MLDLYAGSGALGIEALSRGAAQAIFVEQDARVCRQISDNLASLGLAGRGVVRCGRAVSLLPQLAQSAERVAPFTWVFADPPYDSDELPALMARLGRLSLWRPMPRSSSSVAAAMPIAWRRPSHPTRHRVHFA